ncbi:MAG: hypothetical protein E6Q68_06845, partial [Polynucleobacter sp.]
MPVPSYPFDPQGTAPSNKIIGEQHVLTSVNSSSFHFISPRLSPFFEDSLVIEYKDPQGNIVPLTKGIDWWPSHTYIGASRACAKPIFGSITFFNTALAGSVKLTYQTIGGQWVLDDAAYAAMLAGVLYNPLITSWEQISGVPVVFPVVDHQWDLVDMVGEAEVVDAVHGIETAIREQAQQSWSDHIANSNNPHNVSKTQLGLQNIQNYTIANLAEAKAGTADRYIVASILKGVLTDYALTTNYYDKPAIDAKFTTTNNRVTVLEQWKTQTQLWANDVANSLSAHGNAINVHTQQINGLGTRVTALESWRTDVTNWRSGIDTTLSGFTSWKQTTNTRLNTLEGNVGTITSTVNGNTTSISALNTSVATLQNQMSNISSLVGDAAPTVKGILKLNVGKYLTNAWDLNRPRDDKDNVKALTALGLSNLLYGANDGPQPQADMTGFVSTVFDNAGNDATLPSVTQAAATMAIAKVAKFAKLNLENASPNVNAAYGKLINSLKSDKVNNALSGIVSTTNGVRVNNGLGVFIKTAANNVLTLDSNKELSVSVSSLPDNRITINNGAIYLGSEAPPDVANIYLDPVIGSDLNPGTLAQPMRTLAAALLKGPPGVNRNIYIPEGKRTFFSENGSNAVLRGGVLTIMSYGPVVNSVFANPATFIYARNRLTVRDAFAILAQPPSVPRDWAYGDGSTAYLQIPPCIEINQGGKVIANGVTLEMCVALSSVYDKDAAQSASNRLPFIMNYFMLDDGARVQLQNVDLRYSNLYISSLGSSQLPMDMCVSVMGFSRDSTANTALTIDSVSVV